MKTMRYRIRLISLLLCLAILGAALWNLRSLWQPAVEGSLLPAPASSPEMTAVPVGVSPSPSPEPSPSVSPAASPDPVFNTFGL